MTVAVVDPELRTGLLASSRRAIRNSGRFFDYYLRPRNADAILQHQSRPAEHAAPTIRGAGTVRGRPQLSTAVPLL